MSRGSPDCAAGRTRSRCSQRKRSRAPREIALQLEAGRVEAVERSADPGRDGVLLVRLGEGRVANAADVEELGRGGVVADRRERGGRVRLVRAGHRDGGGEVVLGRHHAALRRRSSSSRRRRGRRRKRTRREIDGSCLRQHACAVPSYKGDNRVEILRDSKGRWIAGPPAVDKLLHLPTSAIVRAAAILFASLIWPAPRDHANGGLRGRRRCPTRVASPRASSSSVSPAGRP